jgi:hypothetical protein
MIIRRQKFTETAEENKVEQADCPPILDNKTVFGLNFVKLGKVLKNPLDCLCNLSPLRKGIFRNKRSLPVCHKKYIVWALALKAIRL